MAQSHKSRKLAQENRKGRIKGLKKVAKLFQPTIPPEVAAQVSRTPNSIIHHFKPPPLPRTIGQPPLIARSTAASNRRLRDLIAEKYGRMREPLKMYRPLSQQRAFHESDAFIRLAIGSNRSGKTLISSVEVARAVLNCDPYDKYPKTGVVYVVGKSLAHIADTIYRKLCLPGFIRIIPKGDGEWEVYQPWRKDHTDRFHESKESGPLIPKRFIKRIKFEDVGKNEVSSIELTTGWVMRFFSARGLLPQGAPADIVWLDEEIVDSQDGPWVPEMIARLTDRKGRMIWSATPQNGFANLLEMSDRADRQLEMWLANPKDNPKPDVVRFDLKIDENAYQDKASVDRFRRSLSDDELAIRFGGMSMVNSIRVYPEWNLSTHGFVIKDINGNPLTSPPRHWTHYAIIDPGHSICAVLFCAVPPPEESPSGLNLVVAYDELYIPQCNAAMFAEGMYGKCLGQPFQTFIIDGHGARPTEAGSGFSIEEQYSNALRQKNIKSATTGHGFIYGNDDRAAGVLTVHEFLMKRDGAPPRFVVAVNPDDPSQPLCPILHSEMVKYKKQRVNGLVIDTPYDRGPTHLCQCVRYICSFRPEYADYVDGGSGYNAFIWKNKFPSFMNLNGNNNGNTVNLGCGH